MPRIFTTVSEDTYIKLNDIAKNERESVSKMACNMLDLGIKIYEKQHDPEENERKKKEQELQEKTTEYLLRIVNITSDMMRKLYGEQSRFQGDNADEILTNIKDVVQKHFKKP